MTLYCVIRPQCISVVFDIHYAFIKETAFKNTLTEDEGKDHMKEIRKEFGKVQPDERRIQMLLGTRNQRRHPLFNTVGDRNFNPIMKCILCYEDGSYVSKY